MSILDINNKKQNIKKTLILYTIFTAFVILANKTYALFGHGVTSDYMSWMFLYPLIGGLIYFTIIRMVFKKTCRLNGYRFFYNLHNTGIALLTVGSFLKGVLGIAGTSSNYNTVFFVIGWFFILIGQVLFFSMAVFHKKFLL